MNTLFSAAGLESATPRPLADQLRPASLSQIVGQDHLLKEGAPLAQMVRAGQVSSMILWGPPGVGKTTIARLIAKEASSSLAFEQISAIFSGVADLRKVFENAEQKRAMGMPTILFVDEIHRFNKAQQDGFLPHMESGLITLIGATTENPSFELNAALLSRAQVLVLKRLEASDLESLLERAETHTGQALNLTSDARLNLINMCDGDGRFLLNCAEKIFSIQTDDKNLLGPDKLATLLQRRAPIYDKSQEGHYNLASALQKSIRGSDVDAALYWTARMLDGGEDPKFILRRLIVIASEDVGNADPQALPLAIAARDAFEFIGQPEGEIAIGQLVCYLATAPKSNRSYTAFKQAKSLAKKTGSLAPPLYAMNAPTSMMKDLGYSDGYVYDHDTMSGFAGLNYFPTDLERSEFYQPRATGYEREIQKRLEWWRQKRAEKSSNE